jgi:hypothetical protein
MSKYEITNYGSGREILKFADYVGIAVTVDDTGVAVDPESGKRIVPAGTILGGVAAPFLTDNTQRVGARNDAGAEGVLLYDVDVTHGPAPASMVIQGFIDINKLPTAPAAAAVTALRGVQFID